MRSDAEEDGDGKHDDGGAQTADGSENGVRTGVGVEADGGRGAAADDREVIEPAGYGEFGPIFTQFKGNAKGAVNKLIELQDGEAIGALHHKDVGDIDLVWGNEGTGHSDGYGLAKLVKFHPEVIENLQEILDDMIVVKRSDNRINLESDTHKASVRLTWNEVAKKWLLTAFEKKETPELIDKTTDTDDNPTDMRGDTALSQSSGISDGKDNTLSGNMQGAEEEKPSNFTITPGVYVRKTGKGDQTPVWRVKSEKPLTLDWKDEEKIDRYVNGFISGRKSPKRGWLDRETGEYMMRSEEAAKGLVEILEAMEMDSRLGKGYLSAMDQGIMREAEPEYRVREGKSAGERLLEIEALEPIEVEWNELSREELREVYNNLPTVEKNGRQIEFYRSAFKKIYKDGGLFGQVVPVLDEVLEQAVLAYTEEDNLGGAVRPDGTVHKEHPNVESFDNCVGKVRVNGKEYYVRTTVKREIGQAGAHSFFVSNVDLYKKTTPTLTLPNFPSGESNMERLDTTESQTIPITSRGTTDFDGITDAKLAKFFERASAELRKDAESEPEYRTAAEGDDGYLPNRGDYYRMIDAAEDAAAELGEKVIIHHKPSEIEDGEARRLREKQDAMGWYDPKDGTIHINAYNHEGAAEMVRTVMHEAVGHKGIEGMMGVAEWRLKPPHSKGG